MPKHSNMPIVPLVSTWAVVYFAHGFWVIFQIGGGGILCPKLPNFQRKSAFLHLLRQSIEKIWGHIDQKFIYHQLEQQKLFNLVTNFMQIGLSKAKICWNSWKMSKLPLKLRLQLDLHDPHLWNALKSRQMKIETCGLHHWLALEL